MRTFISIVVSYLGAVFGFIILISFIVIPTIAPREGEVPKPRRFALFLPAGVVGGVFGAMTAYRIGGDLNIVVPVLGSLLFFSTVAPLQPEKVPKVPRWWIFALALSLVLGVTIVVWVVGLPEV